MVMVAEWIWRVCVKAWEAISAAFVYAWEQICLAFQAFGKWVKDLFA
jgi:hypothetical protein